jgi:hypothetical protein
VEHLGVERGGNDGYEEPRSNSKAAHSGSPAEDCGSRCDLDRRGKLIAGTASGAQTDAEAMAHVLGIGQDSVSRLEQRSDLLISTLRGYVEALGGRLSLVAEFPNQKPVVLTGIAALEGASAANGRKG